MARTRCYRRRVRQRSIRRKLRIQAHWDTPAEVLTWVHNQPGRLAKAKIHCSCWFCRRKSYDHRSHRDKVVLNVLHDKAAECPDVSSTTLFRLTDPDRCG